jgi:hypothetical protein
MGVSSIFVLIFFGSFLGVQSGVSGVLQDVASQKRRVVQWLVPYGNITTINQYVTIWGQLKDNHRPLQNLYAASAYALKENNASLGYATTPAGEASYGLQMEQIGMPALRSLGLGDSILGMCYVTHYQAIANMLKNTSAFINQLLLKADEQSLLGFDIDYEPQGVIKAEEVNKADGISSSTFMQFVQDLAAALHSRNKILTIDISGCPDSNAFHCASVSTPNSFPGLALVNCEDSFGAGSLDSIKQLQQSDGISSALADRWAPGWEPNNIGPQAFQTALSYLVSSDACSVANGVCPTAISTWAVNEWNTGPQPQWLFDAINSFLDAPLVSSTTKNSALPLLSNVFGSNMVFQRNVPAAIWGWTSVGSTVTVLFRGVNFTSPPTDDAGKWEVNIPAQPASENIDITITDTFGNVVSLTNVAFGDVFW